MHGSLVSSTPPPLLTLTMFCVTFITLLLAHLTTSIDRSNGDDNHDNNNDGDHYLLAEARRRLPPSGPHTAHLSLPTPSDSPMNVCSPPPPTVTRGVSVVQTPAGDW